jgi:AraC-like DNA-binding protein
MSLGSLYQPFPMLPARRAQVWRHRPEYCRPRHFHDEPELNLVVTGQAHLGIGERRVTLRAGEVAFFAPGQDHQLLHASSDLSLYVLALTPELAAHLPSQLPRSDGEVPHDLLTRVVERLDAASLGNDHAWIEGVLLEGFRQLQAYSAPLNPIGRRAGGLLRGQPALACGEVASALGVHRSELTRAFQRAHGMSVVEYRTRLRLMKFVGLVDEGRTFTQAALEADFGSYAQCFRVFQRVMGCAPSAYFGGARQSIESALASAGTS